MRLYVRHALFLSGVSWTAIGLFLLIKGLRYLYSGFQQLLNGREGDFFLLKRVTDYTQNPTQTIIIVMCSSLLIGLFKGRVILRRSVNRVIDRLYCYHPFIAIKNLYSKGYLFLIVGMLCMGILFKKIPFTTDIKGFIDATIGISLISGSLFYYRAFYSKKGKYCVQDRG